MKARIIATLLLLMSVSSVAMATGNYYDRLSEGVKRIADSMDGKLGVAVIGIEGNDTFSWNGGSGYPMQSVYKFPLALHILHLCDQGYLSLSHSYLIPRALLDTNTWSPMVKDFPRQDIALTLADLLKYSVSKSDNNACDILFYLGGGQGTANAYLHTIGIKGIEMMATEAQMKQSWDVQYTNRCAPMAMAELLRRFYTGKLLSKSSYDFLLKLMIESANPDSRIKGLLPAGTVVAHKTGTSNQNSDGITAATNDVGIVTLPSGAHVAIVVYVSDYKGGTAKGERVIAEISKLVWDVFSGQ